MLDRTVKQRTPYKLPNENIYVFRFDNLSFVGLYKNTRKAEEATGVFNANIGRYLKEEYFSLPNKNKEYFVMVLATKLTDAKQIAKIRKAKDTILHLNKEEVSQLDDKIALKIFKLLSK